MRLEWELRYSHRHNGKKKKKRKKKRQKTRTSPRGIFRIMTPNQEETNDRVDSGLSGLSFDFPFFPLFSLVDRIVLIISPFFSVTIY